MDYPDEEYSDQEEYQDNVLEEQRERWEEETGGNYPAARRSESLFSLFRRVWRTPDSSKVANLEKGEIGDLGISVRDAQNISKFAAFLGHNGVRDYFRKIAEITLATSMSRKGWFVELFVTSKKFAHKGATPPQFQQQGKKWRIFAPKETPLTE